MPTWTGGVQDVGTTSFKPEPEEPIAILPPTSPCATSPASLPVPLAPTPSSDKCLTMLAHVGSLDTLFTALVECKMNHRWETDESPLGQYRPYRGVTVHSELVSPYRLLSLSFSPQRGAAGSSSTCGRAPSKCKLHVDISGQLELAWVVLVLRPSQAYRVKSNQHAARLDLEQCSTHPSRCAPRLHVKPSSSAEHVDPRRPIDVPRGWRQTEARKPRPTRQVLFGSCPFFVRQMCKTTTRRPRLHLVHQIVLHQTE